MGADMSMGLSLIGRLAAQGDYDAANRMYAEILQSISAEDVPAFKQYVAQTVPDIERIQQGGEGRSAQSSAIAKLQSFVDQNGLDAQARSANEQVLSAADQRAQGNRAAVTSNFARRGMGGSGAEFASMLQGNQSAANQGRQSGLQIASDAKSRALSALGEQGSLAGQMRGQDIDVASKNAAAANAREQFNANMRMDTAKGNNQLLDVDFKNRMEKQRAMAAAKSKVAERHLAGAKQTQGDFSSVGQGLNYKSQVAAEGSESMPW